MNKFGHQFNDDNNANQARRPFGSEPVYEPPSTGEYLKILGVCVMGLVALGVVIFVVFNYLVV